MKKITRLVSAIALASYMAGTLAQGALEEVIVTAQKRVQSIQDVPLSITAFSGDFLEESGIDTMEELARLSPNLTISGSSQATNNRISIRGVGSVGNNGIEPSVGVFIDGVYYPRPGSVIGLMVDIQSFEVLRGPQGTLFGRNTPMGALNVTTRNPTNEFEARIEAGFGDYEAWELGGVVSGPLTDSVAGRLAIKFADRDGYGDNLYDGEEFGARDDLIVRGKLQFDFSDSLTALVTADYSELNGEGSAVEQLNDTANPTFDANQIDLYGQAVGTNDSYDWKINQEHEDDLNDEQQGLSVDINYDFSIPMFFVPDDHDYFEKDDATEQIVTFPPDAFSRQAYEAMADLYYPPLPHSPAPSFKRHFGILRFGRLFEAPLLDCAGKLSFRGDRGELLPPEIEDWLKERLETSGAKHFALMPSHPMGWTAGKWREWYPDIVAPIGFKGVVSNELMADVDGELTAEARKYLWPKGWWQQHQRLLQALYRRPGSRFTFSGDIHAQGATEIRSSGKLSLEERPVISVLVGPVSSSDATWPSSARGISAAKPQWLKTHTLIATREVNGFAMLEIDQDGVNVRLCDCGGFDRSKGEDGRIQNVDVVTI